MSSSKSIQVRSWGKKSAASKESSLQSSATLVSSGSDRSVGPFIWDRLIDQDENKDSSLAVDIVFVHGLRGHFLKTWSTPGKNGANLFWPGDLLREDIPKARVISWGYDAMAANAEPGSAVSQNSIFGPAGSLLNDLADKRKGDPKRPIMWVGHSLGGLVIKEAIIRAANSSTYGRDPRLGDIYSSTIGVIFMGTPHRGSPKATLGESAARLTARLLAAGPTCSHIPVVCFYEELKTRRAGLIVPRASAVFDGEMVSFDSIPADHREMARFATRSDIGYSRVLGHIKSTWASYQDVRRREQGERARIAKEEQQKKMKELKEAEEAVHSDILRWLSFSLMRQREDHIEDAHRATLDWVFGDNPSLPGQVTERDGGVLPFSSWLCKNGAPAFWVSGKAGSGKSTFMKAIRYHPETLRRLHDWAEKRPLFVCHFFLYELGSDLDKCREGMLRSILYQLLTSDHGLELSKTIFASQFLGINDQLPKFSAGIGEHWGALRGYFNDALHAIAQKNWRLCLFVDGLDEYRTVEKWKKDKYTAADLEMVYEGEDGDAVWGSNASIMDDHRQVLTFFKDLCVHPNIKLCLSSRELMIFEDGFAKFPRLRMQDCNKSDIQRFVNDQISQTEISEDGKMALTAKITSKSCGVFLWVRLVVNSVLDGYASGDSLARLHEKIDQAPSRLCGPRGLFMKMLEPAIKDRQVRLESSRIFQMMNTNFMYKPARLNAEYIWYGLESYQEHKAHCDLPFKTPIDFSNTNELVKSQLLKEARRLLKGRSGNLLECEPPDYKVVFMHYSVHQFINRKATWDHLFPPDPEFVPIIAMLSSAIIQIKKYDKAAIARDDVHNDEYTPKEGTFTSYFFQAVGIARTADEDHGDNPLYVKLVDELDKTMTEIYRQVPISQSNHCYWPHTSKPYYDNFLLNAAHWKMEGYIKSKIYNPQNEASTKLSSQKLLEDLIYMRSHFLTVMRKPDLIVGLEHCHPYGDCWWATDVYIFPFLITLGADPKLAWDQFLSLGYAIAFAKLPDGLVVHLPSPSLEELGSTWMTILVEILEVSGDPFQLAKITCEYWTHPEPLPTGMVSVVEIMRLMERITRNTEGFSAFLSEKITLLDGKKPQDPAAYFKAARQEYIDLGL